MSEIKHSPLPWNVYKTRGLYIEYKPDPNDDYKGVVCQVDISLNLFDEQQEANAAFIVRACNSYHKLVEELQKAKGAILSLNSSKYHEVINDDGRYYLQTQEWVEWMKGEVIADINKAIAEAEAA